MNKLQFNEFRRMISNNKINYSKEKTISSGKTIHRKKKKIINQILPQTLNLKSYYSINKEQKKLKTLRSYREKGNKNYLLNSPNISNMKNIPKTSVKIYRKNMMYNCQNSIALSFTSFKTKKNVNKINSNHITIDSTTTTTENHASSKSCKNVHLNKEMNNLKDRCFKLLKNYNNLIIQFEKKMKNQENKICFLEKIC